jgi:hypothetical protein
MRIPPILHKPFCYTAGFHQEILMNQSIVGISQLSQLRHMFATLFYKHMKNANESITSDILIAFPQGCGHRLYLRSKPLKRWIRRHRRGIGRFAREEQKQRPMYPIEAQRVVELAISDLCPSPQHRGQCTQLPNLF